MTVQNPWTVGGALTMDFTTPSQTVSKTLSIPSGGSPPTTQVRTVTLDQTDMQKLQGEKATVVLTGTMTSAAPITVTPRQEISIDNRIILTVRTGGGK